MDVQVFADDEEGYLLWLRGHYMGYVVNAERSLSAPRLVETAATTTRTAESTMATRSAREAATRPRIGGGLPETQRGGWSTAPSGERFARASPAASATGLAAVVAHPKRWPAGSPGATLPRVEALARSIKGNVVVRYVSRGGRVKWWRYSLDVVKREIATDHRRRIKRKSTLSL